MCNIWQAKSILVLCSSTLKEPAVPRDSRLYKKPFYFNISLPYMIQKQIWLSHIRTSTHLINILNKFIMPPGMLPCTVDITRLYTKIPHNEVIQSIKELLAIHKLPNSLPHNSYISELLEVVLTYNYFEFNGKHYHQVSGNAMATNLAPSCVNLFMIKFEKKYVYTFSLQPKLWKRFIDDIFLTWPHRMDLLLEFINHLNTVHSTIKFTSDMSPTESAFLDLIIYIKGKKLNTRLHTKPTDRHMHLNYNSEHPMTLKRSIPYSQFLRLKRVHSEPHYLLEAQIHIYVFLICREFSHDIVLDVWLKTSKFTREQLLSQTNNNKTDTPLMFITTYSSANPNFKELFSKH